MKKYLMLGFFIALVSIALALAKPDLTPHLASVEPSGGQATVIIPENAVEVSPGVFSLGVAIDKGRAVEGYAIIDYKEGFAKPTCNNNGVCEPELGEKKNCADCAGNGEATTSSCYGFLANGAKWKTVEPYIVNPANTEGLSSSFVTGNLDADIGKWETAAGTNIIGTGSSTSQNLVADTISPDDKNEVYFADVGSPGAIAVTIVWGIFRGPPRARELVEWDQVYDQVDYNWSADCTSEDCVSRGNEKMDFENIAIHELGHSVGLDDLYEERCSEQTMYGYAGYGETKKRTLESGDIRGIQGLYS